MIIRLFPSGIAVSRDLRRRDRFLPVIAAWFSPSYHRVTSAKTLEMRTIGYGAKVVTDVRCDPGLGPTPECSQALDGGPVVLPG